MERLGRCLISYDTKKTIKEDRVKSGRERKRGMAKKSDATHAALLSVLWKLIFIFPRRWRICIHFSQRINKWEKIWSAAPSVCRNEKDGRARKSAEERAGPIRGANPWRQTSPTSFLELALFFCRPASISYHTHERRISEWLKIPLT